MSAIFLVTSGSYGEYHVAGVFSTRALAEKALAEGIGDDVEEMFLDPPIEPKPPGLNAFSVTISNIGDSCMAREESPYGCHADDGSFPLRWAAIGEVVEHGTNEREYYYRTFRVWAADSQSATIAVLNHRAALITSGKWPHVEPPKPPPPGIAIEITREHIVNDGMSNMLGDFNRLTGKMRLKVNEQMSAIIVNSTPIFIRPVGPDQG